MQRTRSIALTVLLCSSIYVFSSCYDPTPPGNGPSSDKSYSWSIDTLHFEYPGPPPDQVNVQCIWGSSAHDVWATATADDVAGELWHFDGRTWHTVPDWPLSGIDSGGTFINDIFAVTGFDSANVFVFGHHGYDTTGRDIVLKWNGQSWSTLPWVAGSNLRGGLGWGLKQNNDKLWAVSSTGQVARYENGFMMVDFVIPSYRLGMLQIASLDNGEVFVNPVKDSLIGDTLLGRITKLYVRNVSGSWSMLENKFIAGGYEDGVGFGGGIVSVGNHLFTFNRGLLEKIGSSWVRRFNFDNFGGTCLVAPNDLWIYFNRSVWHYDGKIWSTLTIPLLAQYTGFYLYGNGWSNGKDIFISLTEDGDKSYILHGKLNGL